MLLLKKALRELFEKDEEMLDWNQNFTKNDDLHNKITEDIESVIAEKNKIGRIPAENKMSRSDPSPDHNKISNYIQDISTYINKDLKAYLFERYIKIIKRYKKIESMDPNINTNSNRLIKYIFECYAKDKCQKLDHSIHTSEFNRLSQKAVQYTSNDYKSDILNLKSLIFKEIDGLKNNNANRQKELNQVIKQKWFVFNCLKNIFEYGIQDSRLFNEFFKDNKSEHSQSTKLSIKSIQGMNSNNSSACDSKLSLTDGSHLYDLSQRNCPLQDIMNGPSASKPDSDGLLAKRGEPQKSDFKPDKRMKTDSDEEANSLAVCSGGINENDIDDFDWVNTKVKIPNYRIKLIQSLNVLKKDHNIHIMDEFTDDIDSLLVDFKIANKKIFGSLKLRLYIDDEDPMVDVIECKHNKIMKQYVNKLPESDIFVKLVQTVVYWIKTMEDMYDTNNED